MTEEKVSEWDKKRYVPKPGEPELPPQLSELSNKTSKEVMEELNRLPFFMTELDETDGAGGENTNLEALKSLAYDGEPDEIATNFKNQGNDCYKAKQYKNAVEYYTKGLDIECGVEDIDKALYLNRAACNLELRNFRRCIEDCKMVLGIDHKNIKACFRSGKAFFEVGRYDEAEQILKYGLTLDQENTPMKDLLKKIEDKRKKILELEAKKKRERELAKMKKDILINAIKLRHFTIIKTKLPPEVLENANIRLEDETDYESQLLFPAMVLYPTINEFDFIAEVSELLTASDILKLILDRPNNWFEDPKHKGFTLKNLECYLETESGGLIKVGKKVAINTALMPDKAKAPLFDNSLRLYVVPKEDSQAWISEWSKEAALSKRTS
ncbi:uncharacterized protein PRCAT00003770001 [Priceomyces carsonii]|uniref:uncharacterized protein n=1 Tax=Priceomyces carsonii TaxID=28549 RepID=UPI002ED95808|nr:unnamed protein product [Priceomyces carsonii]